MKERYKENKKNRINNEKSKNYETKAKDWKNEKHVDEEESKNYETKTTEQAL
jgi:hypothetical protein